MRVLAGKKALVTGAASGIGRAIALALAAQRTSVYLLDIDEAGAADVAAQVRSFGVEARSARCDVTHPAEITRAIRQMLAVWPSIDILVNNAGVAYYGPTENMTAEQWDWLLAINLRAPIQFTRELLPTLLAQGEGHIVNVCSIAGLVAGGRSSAYQVSKFGLVGFTEALRSEYVRRGVGLTALCPGPVRTNLYSSAVSGRTNRPVPVPPAWVCASPERVAAKAIAGIKGNKPLVLVTPMAYALSYLKRLSPRLMDFVNCLGKRRRAAPSLAGAVAETTVATPNAPASTEPFERLYFNSRGVPCEAWLMRSRENGPTPLVVMAHGFAAEKSFGLMPFAERFVERGLAVMLFDYRHFGGSGGWPRNLVSPRRQAQDWQAALDFAGKLPGIDRQRIGLWGTSFSGGHVLNCAARNPHVAAVVAQVPMLDVPGSLRGYKLRYGLQSLWHGGRDLLRAATFRRPHTVPVVADGSTFGVMNKAGCESGYLRLVPDGSQWDNRCPARTLLTSLVHRPITQAKHVQCPALLVLAENDQLVPPRTIRKAAAKMREATVLSLPVDHFAVYSGDAFEQAVTAEADFLQDCLGQAYTLSFADAARSLTTKNKVVRAGRAA